MIVSMHNNAGDAEPPLTNKMETTQTPRRFLRMSKMNSFDVLFDEYDSIVSSMSPNRRRRQSLRPDFYSQVPPRGLLRSQSDHVSPVRQKFEVTKFSRSSSLDCTLNNSRLKKADFNGAANTTRTRLLRRHISARVLSTSEKKSLDDLLDEYDSIASSTNAAQRCSRPIISELNKQVKKPNLLRSKSDHTPLARPQHKVTKLSRSSSLCPPLHIPKTKKGNSHKWMKENDSAYRTTFPSKTTCPHLLRKQDSERVLTTAEKKSLDDLLQEYDLFAFAMIPIRRCRQPLISEADEQVKTPNLLRSQSTQSCESIIDSDDITETSEDIMEASVDHWHFL